MDDRMSDKPLGRLLLEGLGEIAWIAVLVALGVLLPLPLVALGWALLLGAEWAMDRWRGRCRIACNRRCSSGFWVAASPWARHCRASGWDWAVACWR